ncbi:MAG: twin transmembrane helix small protein [Gammaproteobacteria bacterium]|nr:twin transmembrane helix small protein [Gammaproteobacteria bacterium]
MAMKAIVIAMLIGIFVSLASAAVYLFRERGDSAKMAKALTYRVGLSVGLFLLLMAGFYFGIISPSGI